MLYHQISLFMMGQMMGRKAKDLTPLAINKKTEAGMHFVGHVAGLILRVAPSGSRSWILRMKIGDRRRDMGLGSYPEVTLAMAKELATEYKQKVKNGIDPIDERKEAQAALRAEQASFITFKESALQYIAAHQAGWKNTKHISQWRNTLETYVYPVIGDLSVKDIAVDHVIKTLEPIWYNKTETASRIRNRIELILDWARARGSRSGENPARWKGNLDALLPAPSKIAKTSHHKALSWKDTPEFMQKLLAMPHSSAQALAFTILTSTRSGEVRNATWEEIDFEDKVWIIPAERMKAGKEHRVPLSEQALNVLKKQARIEGVPYLFMNKNGKALSDMALTQQIRRMKVECTVHGFRSTFRDWAGETTSFAREIIEHALAHQLQDKAEAAYARGDMLAKRRKLMDAWAEFLEKPAVSGNVTPIRKEVNYG